jgi:hypothetical protein
MVERKVTPEEPIFGESLRIVIKKGEPQKKEQDKAFEFFKENGAPC